jgi:hypothetical protein
VIGNLVVERHYHSMKRWRAISAILGCLAVLTTGLATVAYAWTPLASPTSGHEDTAIGALCTQHCPSCEGMPCPPSAAGCVVACVGTAPSLITAVFTLPVPDSRSEVWPVRFAKLHGLSPPPDPSPPRS